MKNVRVRPVTRKVCVLSTVPARLDSADSTPSDFAWLDSARSRALETERHTQAENDTHLTLTSILLSTPPPSPFTHQHLTLMPIAFREAPRYRPAPFTEHYSESYDLPARPRSLPPGSHHTVDARHAAYATPRHAARRCWKKRQHSISRETKLSPDTGGCYTKYPNLCVGAIRPAYAVADYEQSPAFQNWQAVHRNTQTNLEDSFEIDFKPARSYKTRRYCCFLIESGFFRSQFDATHRVFQQI